MSTTTHALDETTATYVQSLARQREGDVLAELRAKTADMPNAMMQISVEQGRFMALFVATMGVKRAIEVGTFTGYSALCVASQLPADGTLVACDVSEEWTSIGRPFWRKAGVEDRIDLRIGAASDTLAKMIDAGEAGTYDFAFIDADKVSYPDYYEKCLTLLRVGGVIAVDNIFMHGKAINPAADDASSKAIHSTTQKAFADDRVQPSLLPIGDGLLVVRKL